MVSCENISTVRFDDYQVYRIIPHTNEHLKSLQDFYLTNDQLDFWAAPSKEENPVDIMIPPDFNEKFLNFIKFENFDDAEVWIENVQERIKEINSWLDSLTKKYPGVVTNLVGGNSYEGRTIRGVKVSFGTKKRGVFLEGGIHAREWIAPATVTYILNELLTNTDPSVSAIATAYEWYVFPCVNPDGYVYSYTTNRMWRKNRKPFGRCHGTDLNRNWNYHWNEGGSSGSACHEKFRGSYPFSEIETKTLSEYISTIARNLEAYISFHSYSQVLLIPFGHSGHEVPTNNHELLSIGKAAVDKLTERYGTKYSIGNTFQAKYVASGSSVDWVKGMYRRIRLAYAFELRDKGKFGFILPKDQILPTSEETFDALLTMLQKNQKT